MRPLFLASLLFPLLPALRPAASAAPLPGPAPENPSPVADFAIYDPLYEDDGVWEEEVTALRTLLDAFGWSYLLLDETTLDATAAAGQLPVLALIAPGGWAAARNRALPAAADRAIRSFVATGGNYVGFCAGAYSASDSVSFARYAWRGYVRPWLYLDYGDAEGYDLNLWPGTARGPFGWAPWRGGTHPTLEPARIDLSSPVMAAIGIPPITRFFYYGGPVFLPPDPPLPEVEVWCRAIAPGDAPPAGRGGEGEATAIRFPYGAGTVILLSYHPEILIDSWVDGVRLSTYFDEQAIDWDTGDQTLEEINLQSWNLVHAALQIAANEEPTPLTELPPPPPRRE